ncbi:MAG: hypothetical protein CMM84_20350 [Rhodothermaceae bacterium]|nr:hypothetical protein [Rhodothermaceae bacterium]
MTVLGLSCFYHDAAAALVRDGEIVAAAQEERFTRRKHDPSFPSNAAAYCLAEAGIEAADLDAVAFYDKPLLTFERLLETYLAYAPRGLGSFLQAMPLWLRRKLWTPDILRKELGGYEGPLVFAEHHRSHAASAFYPSPFERAAVLTTDGVGEWATTSWGVGDGAGLDLRQEIHFPHSLGLLYSAFTTFCGFRVNSGEYKLMGLAPYGEPRYVDTILEHLIDLRADGSYRLHADAFTFPVGLRMTGRRFETLFGGPAREPEGPLTQREMDLARSVQAVVEEAVLRMARHVHVETGEADLCLAGGVALNCVANGRLLREGPFERIWVQPAAGDAGGALGAALVATHEWAGLGRTVHPEDGMHGSYLGPQWSVAEVRAALDAEGLTYETLADDDALCDRVAGLLAEEKTVGWFQGRAEFGPRALGHRSILADPRGRAVQRRVNLQIKFRESFRPFAPSVLAERADEVFDLGGTGNAESGATRSRPSPDSPYMLLVGPVRGATVEGEGLGRMGGVQSTVPAVTHVDGSARVQTVTEARNGLYYHLLKAFEARTGCPVLVNTSFNVRGEPIVHAPADALRVFRRTHMDALAIGPFVLTRDALAEAERQPFTAEQIAETYGLD